MRVQVGARALATAIAIALVAVVALPRTSRAQWVTTFDQFYFPDRTNWAFRNNYPPADRLFNAFDYGHAILYEKLYTRPNADPSILEEKEYDFITRKLLVDPPRLPLEEGAIEVAYAKIAPEAKAMFDWAHVLHRQVYDVWADERVPLAEKDARIAKLLRYYKSRPDLAFSSVPKKMELMEGQYYSRAFREHYPKFNGLIWGYHWLQVGLYEPLVTGKNVDERQTGVLAAVARFRQMLENAPEHMPRLMPMTAAIAPTFSARYPEAAIIFDNLHAMHDVISDILASPKVPRERKRQEILIAAARYRDSSSFAMTRKEWSEMAQMMGVANMGGPAVHFLPDFPTPTVARGASAEEAMKSMHEQTGAAAKAMPGMPGMEKPMSPSAAPPAAGHEHTPGMPTPGAPKEAMPGMPMPAAPGMPMPEESSRKASDAMPGMRDMPRSGVRTKAASPAAPRSKAAAKRKSSASTSPSKTRVKKAAKPKAKKAPMPAKKPPPPMDHTKMPGMKMP
jgi:hypothetical protein